jgi:hypothetical protein
MTLNGAWHPGRAEWVAVAGNNEVGMNGLFGKGKICALLVATMAAGAVTPALAGGSRNCDSYAKLTLQQAKQNIDRRCNFKGPAWSLDAARHRKWCEDVGPAVWRAELLKRNKMLAGCRG